MFAALYHPEELSQRILPDRSAIPKFWAAIRNHPMLNGHHVKSVTRWNYRRIPNSAHGGRGPRAGGGEELGNKYGAFIGSVMPCLWCYVEHVKFIVGNVATALVTAGEASTLGQAFNIKVDIRFL